jgi:hypothetical protein
MKQKTSLVCLTLLASFAASALAQPSPEQKPAAHDDSASASEAAAAVVDLSSSYQRTFKPEDKGGFVGRQMIDGLPFELGGEVRIYGSSNAERNHEEPKEVSEIKIGRAFDELHLLHAVQWDEYEGCPVATIRLHYADRSTRDLAIRYGYQVRDWNRLLTEDKETIADPNTKIIWRGDGFVLGTGRLFKSALKNPFPKKVVTSMDLVSTCTRASYTLVAATIANRDPRRPVTPGMPLEPSRNYDGTLTVQVLDKRTGAPLPGADVDASMDINGYFVVCTPVLASKTGEVTLKYPTASTTLIRVEVSKPGFAKTQTEWSKESKSTVPSTIAFRLEPASSFSSQ